MHDTSAPNLASRPVFRRITIDAPPAFGGSPARRDPWVWQGEWPARWIDDASIDLRPGHEPWFAEFRCAFELASPLACRFHVTADERYELFIDGHRVGRGPERGDRANWFYESYELRLPAGRHVIAAHVHALGPLAPWAQVQVTPGLLVCAEGDDACRAFATGVAHWQVRTRAAWSARRSAAYPDIGTGPEFVVDARVPDAPWHDARPLEHGNNGFALYVTNPIHLLKPATLPAMLDARWTRATVRAEDDRANGPWREGIDGSPQLANVLAGKPVVVNARSVCRALIDLGDYTCVYPAITVSAGRDARVDLRFAEALVEIAPDGSSAKRHRDRIDGMTLVGYGDAFFCDGERRTFEVPWWRCGRYAELVVTTGDQPITIEAISFDETRYPLSIDASWKSDDERDERIARSCQRTLETCMHETHVDCPFYEQLMYIGDTRLQALTTYAVSRDARLAAKALRMFDASTSNPSGLPTSNHPARSGQLIPPFTFAYIGMLRDRMLYRGDAPLLRSLLPRARGAMDVLLQHVASSDELLVSPPGWNFVDWAFRDGIPPGGQVGGRSCVLNLSCVLALEALAEVEAFAGEPEMASRWRRAAPTMLAATVEAFWDESAGLFWDDVARTERSEHAQVLALLSHQVASSRAERLIRSISASAHPAMRRPTPYFLHYRFEAAALHRVPLVDDRLTEWHAMLAAGLMTTPETALDQPRSDCHAWSAHPLYHLIATIAGIRPAQPAFTRVRIAPLLGSRSSLDVATPHPGGGTIRVQLRRAESRNDVTVETPVPGELVTPDGTIDLIAGKAMSYDWQEPLDSSRKRS
jgi:hypothetical protein